MRKELMLVFLVVLVTARASDPQSSVARSAPISRHGLDIWLTRECPHTLQEDKDREPLSGFVDFLTGGAIDFLVDRIGSALAEAAKVDKEGRATYGKSPGFLFEFAQPKKSGEPTYYLPTCVTMAISNSEPKKWCAEAPFKDKTVCKKNNNCQSRLESLLTFPKGTPLRRGSNVPKFYAEIELYPSPDQRAFMPRLRALYYPAGIHKSGKFSGNKKRDLLLKVMGSEPSGDTAISTISVVLKDMVPSNKLVVREGSFKTAIPNAALDNAEPTLWTAVAASPKHLLDHPSPGTRFYPVNLSGEVREIGDPNKFLQVLASAFTKNQEDLAKELKSRLVPGQRREAEANTELQNLSNASSIATAIAKAYENEIKLWTACEKLVGDDPNNIQSEIRQHWYATQAAQLAVRKLEQEHGTETPETFRLKVESKPFNITKSALDNCKAIGVK